METKILACATLKNELNFLLEKHQLDYETIWIESGLHNRPEKLHERLETELTKIENCNRLLVAFGKCENALENLPKGPYELIYPRVEDCISLFFGSDAARNAYGKEHLAIYLTQGWMEGEANLISEYQHMLDKYDKETADDVMAMMYAQYKELALLDTKVTDINELWEETDCVEEFTKLKRAVVPASLGYLEQLLTGPWTEAKFQVVPASESKF